MPIAVITDSTADLPPDLAASLGIRVVPLNVHFGEETFLDGVTLKSDEFFKRMKASVKGGSAHPKTSQPSVGAFVEAYTEAGKRSKQILSIHLSSKVSGTYNSAFQARQELAGKGYEIEVIDTLQASMALGLVVIQVADAVKAGASLKDAAALARDLSKRARFFGLLDTLEYLHRGGRVGRAKLYLGSLLSIKPILALVDGVAHPVDRARSRAKGIVKITEMARKEAPLSALCILYGEDRAAAEAIAADLKDLAPGKRPLVAQLGPVLGTYLGPEALAITLVRAGKAGA